MWTSFGKNCRKGKVGGLWKGMKLLRYLNHRLIAEQRTAIHAACVLLLAYFSTNSLQAEDQAAWKTGLAFRQQLSSLVGFQWSGSATLRPSLASLARSQQVAIWLDRRVDPDQPVEMGIHDVSLRQALRIVAGRIGCGVCFVDSVVYIGPPSITEKLATLAAMRRDEAQQLPTAARTKLQHAQPWTWDEASAPKELLAAIAEEANLKISEADRLPHDLWAAGDLPSLAVTDRMSLLLAGFDLTFDIAKDGSAIRPTPIPGQVSLQRTYTPRGAIATATAKIAREFPQVGVQTKGQQLIIVGSFEDHDQIARLLRGEAVAPPKPTGGEKRYDLTTQSPVGAIVKLIGEREKLQVTIDPAAAKLLQTRVSVEVKQATLLELLDATLDPAGIRYELEGQSLRLLPAE